MPAHYICYIVVGLVIALVVDLLEKSDNCVKRYQTFGSDVGPSDFLFQLFVCGLIVAFWPVIVLAFVIGRMTD